jgi:hypothetical protein
MPSYVYTYVLFHLLLNTSVSSRLTTIPITRLITIRYTYHRQYDKRKNEFNLLTLKYFIVRLVQLKTSATNQNSFKIVEQD